MDLHAIETKLAAARTRLILDKPFLGALVLRLPLVAAKDSWCPTTATDARGFYFNPEYIDGLNLSQAQFMLAHEALHCALSHFARRGHRLKHKWDLACDFAINPLLVEEGLSPPPDAVIVDEYKGMTAEEIYPLIEDNDETETLDQHVYDATSEGGGGGGGMPPPQQDRSDQSSEKPRQGKPDDSEGGGEQQAANDDHNANGGGQAAEQTDSRSGEAEREPEDGLAGQPEPLSSGERETLGIQWQQRMAGAAQQAMRAGKFGGTLARLIDHLLQPQIPWRMLLARFLSNVARDDFTYMRPSRREGEAIFPSLRSAQVDVAVAVDTSGSIKRGEIDEFLSEIDAIKGQIRARVTLLPCDAALVEGAPWIFEPWEDFDVPDHLTGGGGTDFRPVFEWLDRHGVQPDLLVYFTDAQGPFPEAPPPYPVLWLVKGKEKCPWGERIQLN
jgi:predicted metal-dependent peptidase